MSDLLYVPVRYLDIHHYVSYYDHPLEGVCIIDGRWHWFNWEYQSDVAIVRKMSRKEIIFRWIDRIAFLVMVSGRSSNDSRLMSIWVRIRPEWLRSITHRAYYSMRPLWACSKIEERNIIEDGYDQ